MSFKGEIALGVLNSKYKYGFTVGDIYRVQGAGNLVPNNLAVANGAFVEWTSDGWEVKKDMQYAVSKTGESLDDTAASLEEVFFANMDVPASTLRFSFGDPNYDPTKDTTVASRHNTADRAGGGTPVGYGGTWKKLLTKFANIWDWTNENVDWHDAFYQQLVTTDCAIIAAGDTSSVTNTNSMFGDCDKLKSVVLFDVSSVTNATDMFMYCTNLTEVPNFNFASLTEFSEIFPGTGITETPRIDTSNAESVNGLYMACADLTVVNPMDTGNVTDFTRLFAGCVSIRELPNLDTSKAGGMRSMLSECVSLRDVPQFDYSNVVTLRQFLAHDPEYCGQAPVLDRLPDLSTLTNKLSRCDEAFKNLVNVKYGILEAYEVLSSCSPSNHTDCFLNCGIDTAEGRAELEQIPASWGGLAP